MKIIKEFMTMLRRRTTIEKYEGTREILMSSRSCRSGSSGGRSSKNSYDSGGLWR